MDKSDLDPDLFKNFPRETIRATYAYLLLAKGDRFLALADDAQWVLPGGIVEGPGAPEVLTQAFETKRIDQPAPEDDPAKDLAQYTVRHSAPLAWLVKQQTGLDLVALSAPFGLKLFEGEHGPSASMLYSGDATGDRLGGELIDPTQIWAFDPKIPLNISRLRTYFGLNPG